MAEMDSQEQVDLSPSKETYRAVRADVTPRSSIRELIDNSIDNWQRLRSRDAELVVEVDHLEPEESEHDVEELIIRDNSGGLEEENLHMFFALGESTKESTENSIGAFGIGAKKACAYLGNIAEFRTNFKDNDGNGYGFTVDEEWLNSEEWDVDKRIYDDIEPGYTEIRIRDLNFDWEDLTAGYTEDEEEEAQGDNPTLAESLQETYEIFLGGGVKNQDYNFRLIVDGEELEAPSSINWSFIPLDGYHPRRFEGFQIEPEEAEYEEPVVMNVTVGLLREASLEASGTDIYCQRRKVLSTSTEEKAGFGTGKYKLGNFGTGQKRLRIVVELETKGDAQNLPWDAQKDSINEYDPVAQEMYKYMRRAARVYFKATYSKFPMTIVRPYGRDSPFAVKGEDGGVKTYDYSGRERVTDKPDNNAPVIKHVKDVAEAHAALGIECDDEMRPEEVPAYQEHIKWAFEKREHRDSTFKEIFGTLKRVSTAPPTQLVERLDQGMENIERIAEEHAERGIRYVGIPEWASRYYKFCLDEAADVDVSGFEEVEELDEPLELVPQSPEEVSDQETEEEEADDEEEPNAGEDETEEEEAEDEDEPSAGEDKNEGQEAEEPGTDASASSSSNSTSQKSSREGSTASNQSTTTEQSSITDTTSSGHEETDTSTKISESPNSASGSESEASTESRSASPQTSATRRKEEEAIGLDTLREILDLPDGAGKDEITDQIADLVEERQELREENDELRDRISNLREELESVRDTMETLTGQVEGLTDQ